MKIVHGYLSNRSLHLHGNTVYEPDYSGHCLGCLSDADYPQDDDALRQLVSDLWHLPIGERTPEMQARVVAALKGR